MTQLKTIIYFVLILALGSSRAIRWFEENPGRKTKKR